jgi:hypothetical protein
MLLSLKKIKNEVYYFCALSYVNLSIYQLLLSVYFYEWLLNNSQEKDLIFYDETQKMMIISG